MQILFAVNKIRILLLILLGILALCSVVCSKRKIWNGSGKQTEVISPDASNVVIIEGKVWDCKQLDACDDKPGLEAILLLHQRLDDDANGNIDIAESDDFLRDELKYSNSYEKQRNFHRNDKHITAGKLWLSWRVSEVHNWTVGETLQWLTLSVELPEYAQNFRDQSVDGKTLPRMAVNSNHFLSKMGIKDPIHKQKISLKAMDVVLFGPAKNHNYVKDMLVVSSLVIAVIGGWFAFLQHRNTQCHLKRTMRDMEHLQNAEEALCELQKELDKAKKEQKIVATEKKNLEQRLQNEITIKHQDFLESSDDQSRVHELEEKLKSVLEDLHSAERDLQDKCWEPPSALQHWLQLTYEKELQRYNAKKTAAEQQLTSAKEGCEKLRKKRSGFLGTFRVAHGSSIDDVDNRILQAKSALSEVTSDLQERLHRWKQMEILCSFSIVHNPGIRCLEAILRSSADSIFSSKINIVPRIPKTDSEGNLTDIDSVSSFPAGISARSLCNIPPRTDIQDSTMYLSSDDSIPHRMKNISTTELKSCASSGAILQRSDRVCHEGADFNSTDCGSFDDRISVCSGQSISDTSRAIFTIGESNKDFILKSPASSGLKHRNVEFSKCNKPSQFNTSQEEE